MRSGTIGMYTPPGCVDWSLRAFFHRSQRSIDIDDADFVNLFTVKIDEIDELIEWLKDMKAIAERRLSSLK